MPAELLDIDGRLWVAGMQWRVHEDQPSRQALRTAAAALQADWIAERRSDGVIQTGYCQAPESIALRKVAALAPAIASLHPAPWKGIYQLDDATYWLIAIGEGGAILAEGDTIGSAAEIQTLADRLQTIDHSQIIEGGFEALFTAARSADRGAAHLHEPSERPKWLLPGIAAMLLTVGATYGAFSWWQSVRQAHEEAGRRQRWLALQAQQAKISPVAALPWPEAWIVACQDAVGSTRVTHDGWMLDSWACETRSVSVSWARGPAATVALRPDGTLSQDGNKVVETLSLPGLQDQGSAWQPAGSSIPVLLALAQQSSTSPAFSGAASLATGPQATLLATARGNWTHFTLDMPITPRGVRWNAVFGLHFTGLTRTAVGYHLEGDIYER